MDETTNCVLPPGHDGDCSFDATAALRHASQCYNGRVPGDATAAVALPELLPLLREHGVTRYRQGDLEIELAPAVPATAPVDLTDLPEDVDVRGSASGVVIPSLSELQAQAQNLRGRAAAETSVEVTETDGS